MSLGLGFRRSYIHSATEGQIMRYASMPTDLAREQVKQLGKIHDMVVAYDPTPGNSAPATAARIAGVLGIEVVTEPIIGQYYILAPSRVAGGVALWRQRVGTVRPIVSHRRQPIFRSERLG